MRAKDFINEENLGTNPSRPKRPGSRPSRKDTAETPYKMKNKEIDQKSAELPVEEDWELAERGKASRALCASSKSDEALGASMLASCKSQGLRARDGKKSHLIGNKRVVVGGKKMKGKKYGGNLPDYSGKK